MPSQENTQELSGAPHPYTKNIRKKFPENKKNLNFRDVKPGPPIYFRAKFREKIPKNASVAKELLLGKNVHKQCFAIHRKFLSFLPRTRFLVFFSPNLIREYIGNPRLISQNPRFFFKFLGIFFPWYCTYRGAEHPRALNPRPSYRAIATKHTNRWLHSTSLSINFIGATSHSPNANNL